MKEIYVDRDYTEANVPGMKYDFKDISSLIRYYFDKGEEEVVIKLSKKPKKNDMKAKVEELKKIYDKYRSEEHPSLTSQIIISLIIEDFADKNDLSASEVIRLLEE